jgi:hypothetical protein
VDEANPQGACRIEALAGREKRAGVSLADLGDHKWADHRGQDAEARLREAEFRAGFREHQITYRTQAHATAECRAVDARDDGYGATIDGVEHLRHDHRVLFVLLPRQPETRAHPGYVGARTKRRAVACQDDCTQLARLFVRQPAKRRTQRTDQLRVECVVNIGSIQGDASDDSPRS